MKKDDIFNALGLEDINATVPAATATEPTEIVEVIPGEAEEIELAVKEDEATATDAVETAATFAEVAGGLESIRDKLVAMRGTQVSTEAFAFASEAITSYLSRIKLQPKHVAGLECFGIEEAEVGVGPKTDALVKTDIEDADMQGQDKNDTQEGVTKEEHDKAAKNEAGSDVTEEKKEKADNEISTSSDTEEGDASHPKPSTEDDSSDADLGGEGEPSADDLGDMTDDMSGGDKPRVQLTITDDQLEVAIEGLNSFIDRLEVGQEGLIDKAAKSVGDSMAKLFKGYESIRIRANNVRVKVKGLSGEAKSETISTSSAHKLHIDGKVTFGVVTTGVANIEKLGGVVFDTYAKSAAGIVKEVATFIVNEADSSNRTGNEEDAFVNGIVKYSDKMRSDIKKVTGASAKLEMPGGLVFGMTNDANTELPRVMVKNKTVKVDTKASIPTPSPKEIDALAAAIAKAGTTLESKGKTVADIKASIKASIQEAKAAVKKDGDGLWKKLNVWAAGKNAKDTLKWWVTPFLIMPIDDFASKAFSSLRSAVQLAEDGVKQYGAKSE